MIKQIAKNKVLVELEDIKSIGKILIPDNAQTKSQYAHVVMVGNDVKEIKRGDKVFVPKYHGTEIKHEGEQFKLFLHTDILGVITQ